MQASSDSPDTMAPSDPRPSEGYYYVDPVAPPAQPQANDFGPGAYAEGPPDVAALLLLVLLLALLIGLVALLARHFMQEQPEDTIATAMKKASEKALAAYGPSTIAAASAFVSQVDKYLGPVRQLIDPVSAGVKKLEAAAKGKTKEPPKGAEPFTGVNAAKLVVMGDFNAPAGSPAPEKPKEVERDMTAEEQIAAARKAIEDLAAVLMAADFRQRLAAARRALNHPPRAPATIVPANDGHSPGGSARIGEVGPRPRPERKPRHR